MHTSKPTDREKVLNELFEGDSDDSNSSDQSKEEAKARNKKDADEFYKLVDGDANQRAS